ncbi:MFS transporter [Amycolatopsis sp. 195334CR]|uniref:MFS transporter n=1 Tax=Amycolatopsis sp. 195334CR TaxID=2814588 RepID=UPI001A906E3C|nr:MFS transporter [Amycolatopsis sp. 195334CR]MBN6038267.1 MFS transporter [Amycolatopsis sp. 195334CR]
MTGFLARFRSFGRPSQVLMLNQFGINLGFYSLMPYLAAYLSGQLALAAWLVGLLLGARNFAQQGLFLVGGTLADRFGAKPLIVAGCVLRTAGFALLALVESPVTLLIASVAIGFAGALFNPAVRAYLAADAGERRVEAFAVFNVFYQAGILAGPVAGLALTAVDFRLTCLVAAVVFAVLAVFQWRALPAGEVREAPVRALASWRRIAGNRTFVRFSLVMVGSYVLSFQMYLALPMEAVRVAGPGTAGTALTTVLFAVSGGLAIVLQLKVVGWCRDRWSPGGCLSLGMVVMAVAFVLPLTTARAGAWVAAVALVVSAALLALGTAVVFPFEMDAIVRLSGDSLVATHYGFYSTVVGVGILLGNLGTGAVFDVAREAGWPEAPWFGLVVIGALGALALRRLDLRRVSPAAAGSS